MTAPAAPRMLTGEEVAEISRIVDRMRNGISQIRADLDKLTAPLPQPEPQGVPKK